MRRKDERSRSPLRQCVLSPEEQEAFLVQFAQHYWLPPDSGLAPWQGTRAERVQRYRAQLLSEVEELVAEAADADPADFGPLLDCAALRRSKESVLRWQRFVFLDDIARMSDVLFRGPIEPKHADEMDARLHDAWRRLRTMIPDLGEFDALTAEFRVSAVKVAMMLETGRPSEAATFDVDFRLPDARTLSCLLSLRCDKDDAEELRELYRLLCQKLQGLTCAHCHEPFDESTSAGFFNGESLVIPVTVPKVFVPQCGHAIHTLCLGSQILPEDGGARGDCRRCGMPYAWSGIDVDPIVNAFCLMFGPYVDQRSQDMADDGKLSADAITKISEVCVNFSLELGGLVSATNAWLLLCRRHTFAEPEIVRIVGEEVLRLLTLPEDARGAQLELPALVPALPSDGSDQAQPAPGPLEPPEFALPMPASPTDEGEASLECLTDDEDPCINTDPSAIMLNQLVEGCGGDRSLNGLLPHAQL